MLIQLGGEFLVKFGLKASEFIHILRRFRKLLCVSDTLFVLVLEKGRDVVLVNVTTVAHRMITSF
jgi:hypothetical protein